MIQDETSKGIWYATVAYAGWGVLPVYWHLLHAIPSQEILAHRILWSFVTGILFLLFYKRLGQVKQILRDSKLVLTLLAASLLISSNWFIYIWAVNHEHVIEASLGYYINPLINVLIGILVLREKLNFWQVISMFVATAGVVVLTVEYGKIPWIAFALALTFAFYGLVKKLAPVESMVGVASETAFVLPIAMIYLFFLQEKGIGSFGHISLSSTIYLLLSGAATTLPLFWFAQAAKKIPFSMLAFIQYISPTISLLLGIFMFKESFTTAHLISFSLIWCAILIYSVSSIKSKQNMKAKA